MIGESSIKEKPLTHDVNNIPATSPHFITSQLPHNITSPPQHPLITSNRHHHHPISTPNIHRQEQHCPLSNHPRPTKKENIHSDHHPPTRHETKPAIKIHIHNLKTTKTTVTQETTEETRGKQQRRRETRQKK
jgi:hypothetical protein